MLLDRHMKSPRKTYEHKRKYGPIGPGSVNILFAGHVKTSWYCGTV